MPSSLQKLDLRTIIEVPLRQFVPWLIALRVGNLCVWRSRSERSSQRLTEAALAGGFLGFLQGILFTGIIPLMGPIQTSE